MRKFKTSIIHKSCKDLSYTTYYLNLTKDLKTDILSKNSFSDWNFPFSVELVKGPYYGENKNDICNIKYGIELAKKK